MKNLLSLAKLYANFKSKIVIDLQSVTSMIISTRKLQTFIQAFSSKKTNARHQIVALSKKTSGKLRLVGLLTLELEVSWEKPASFKKVKKNSMGQSFSAS
jgi:predicted nucleic acid-binding protein